MTMFSMKPKFDLAEFIAESKRKGPRPKQRNTRRMAPRPADTVPASEAETPESKD